MTTPSRSWYRAFLLLAAAGTVIPYAALGWFVTAHGLDASELWHQATGSPIALFAWLDVIIAALAVIAVAARLGRAGMLGWGWAVAATCVIGVSAGLPLLLALRERHRMRHAPGRSSELGP